MMHIINKVVQYKLHNQHVEKVPPFSSETSTVCAISHT